MKYAIRRKDGGVSFMRCLRAEINPWDEIAKWIQADKDNVESVHQIAEIPLTREARTLFVVTTPVVPKTLNP